MLSDTARTPTELPHTARITVASPQERRQKRPRWARRAYIAIGAFMTMYGLICPSGCRATARHPDDEQSARRTQKPRASSDRNGWTARPSSTPLALLSHTPCVVLLLEDTSYPAWYRCLLRRSAHAARRREEVIPRGLRLRADGV